MLEPTTAVPRRNAVVGASCDSSQSIGMAGSIAADILLLESPPRFNGIQVGRVGRQVKESHGARCACGGNGGSL
jgi:hypothetical protein